MRGTVLMVVWLVCLNAAWADIYPITFETYPPNAALHDQFGSFLGKSGQPLRLDWDRAKGPLQLRVSLDGHETVTQTVTLRELQKERYPQKGAIELSPDNIRVAVRDMLTYRRGRVLGMLLAGLGLCALVAKLLRPQTKMIETTMPASIGRFRLLEQIGQGGMSEVFKAQSIDDPAGVPVALKLMHLEIGDNPEAVERFKREIKAHLALSHPNIPALQDWGEHTDGRLYLVMELMQGETLRDRIKRGPRPSDQEVVRVLRALGQALDYLHGQGFVHRDVKPSNVFLGKRGAIKLMDMGIALGQELAPLTRTGMAIGTPHYMAPEQARGQADSRSDQYALGILAYEMLAGRRPFSGSNPTELLRKHVNEPVPPLGDFRPDASAALQEAVHRILCKNPKGRYPDATAAAEAICSALHDDCPEDTQTNTERVDL